MCKKPANTNPVLQSRIDYMREELAWMEAGEPKGKEPWRKWQWLLEGGSKPQWFDCDSPATRYNPHIQLRRKPRFVTINGHEIKAPIDTCPENGKVVYISDTTQFDLCVETRFFKGGAAIERLLSRGLLHETKADAQAHARALLSFTTGNTTT